MDDDSSSKRSLVLSAPIEQSFCRYPQWKQLPGIPLILWWLLWVLPALPAAASEAEWVGAADYETGESATSRETGLERSVTRLVDGEAATPKSILLITIDTLRADALGFSGNPHVETPVLDALAKKGRWFENARAHSVTTLPSHASLLTGRLPTDHGVRTNGQPYDGRFKTLAQLLAEEGFSTAAVVGAFPLDAKFGLDLGFETYDGDFSGAATMGSLSYAERDGAEVVTRALRWWKAHEGDQRFLWVHLFEPHAPYVPIEPLAERFRSRPYLGEVSSADFLLAPLLQPILDGGPSNTMVVMTSDHGESLGEHGELTHGLFAYDATLAVPLVLFAPGVESGADARLARHIDVLPTVLEWAGAEEVKGLRGVSLLAPEAPRQTSYFEALGGALHYGFAPLRGVVAGAHKLVDLPIPELYDLRQDPDEKENLYAQSLPIVAQLQEHLDEDSGWFVDEAPAGVDLGTAQVLSTLGYLGGAMPLRPDTVFDAEDDPKRWIHLDRWLARAVRLDALGEFKEAEQWLRKVIAERPETAAAYEHLAYVLLKDGRPDQALGVMERSYRSGWASDDLVLQFGQTLLVSGRLAPALEILTPLSRKHPTSPNVLEPLAQAHLALGRPELAMSALQTSLKAAPERSQTLEGLAIVSLFADLPEDAESYALRALSIDDQSLSAWRSLAQAREEQGDVSGALEALSAALELAPEDPFALFHMGMTSMSVGETSDGKRFLARFLLTAGADPVFAEEVQRAREALL